MDFLDQPGWNTTGKPRKTTHSICVQAVLITTPSHCTHCGCFPSLLKPHGTKQQMIKDSPVRGMTVEVEVIRKRYRCSHCDRTSLQPLPGVDERRGATARLIELVEQQSLYKPFLQVAQETGLSASTVRAIFNEYIERLKQIVSFDTPRVLGMDGVYIKKKERLILTDIEARRIIEIGPSIKERSVANALFRLRDRRRVEVVTIDMSRSLWRAVRHALPQAVIVIDRFHILSLANDAMDAVRREVRRGMSRYDRKTFKNAAALLRKHLDQLEPKLKDSKSKVTKKAADRADLRKLLADNPELFMAYMLKESFFEIWHSSCGFTARQRYKEWATQVPKEMEYAFKPLMNTVDNWSDELFNYFDYRFTNAYTESVNRQIKSMQSAGRRYDFETIKAKMLYGNALRASTQATEMPEGAGATTQAA
jgi:transposase